MNPYLRFILAALLPVAASVILYLIKKLTAFGQLKEIYQQAFIGAAFGLIAVFGTEYGVGIDGVTMNVRDAAPVCAGLIFGGPAGLIAGAIGGIERFIAAAWGAGEATKIACSVSTMLAGVFSAWLRVHMFDDKRPPWVYGLATGIIVEDIHMLMVFITNMDDTRWAFSVVEKCTIPMVTACGLSSMTALLAVTVISAKFSGKKLFQPDKNLKISQTFQRWLLVCVLAAFALTTLFVSLFESGVAYSQAYSLLRLNIDDVMADVSDASDENLLSISRSIAERLGGSEGVGREKLEAICQEFDVTEINLINTDGIINKSTYEDFVGYDMRSGDQSAEFMLLFNTDCAEYVQSYRPVSYDSSISRKYAAVKMEDGTVVQVGYDAARFQKDISEQIIGVTRNRRIGETGYIIVCDSELNIVSDRNSFEGQSLDKTGYEMDRKYAAGERIDAVVNGQKAFCMYDTTEGYYIVAVYPEKEALLAREISTYITVFMEVIVYTTLFIQIYFLIKRRIVDNIGKVNKSLSEISDGNLDVVVDVDSNKEFVALSRDINSTVVTLKHYIAEAEARIDQELVFAKSIQHSALPTVFPPYPNHSEFDIFARMDTAKEVGGDFYDLYLLDHNRLAFTIADVSGKGIPAAMFMMTSKTMLKNLSRSGFSVEEVFTRANAQLCENNEAGMFVTSWMGVIDLQTGTVTFANAGHNPPLVRRSSGQFEYLRTRAGLVLAGIDDFVYKKNEFSLEPGDMIYLYTDGVTEATNENNELYGEERLLDFLNGLDREIDVETLCNAVKEDIDFFVGDAPQFDDITMLCFKYNGFPEEKTNMSELVIDATTENITTVTEFVDAQLETLDCPMRAQIQINVAIDELFSNIAHYAYSPDVGTATVRVEVTKDPVAVIITFIDNGVPYDPLQNEDPDITLSADDRTIGGLGIYMVKKSMDDVSYEYRNGQNILKIKKNI